MRIERVLTTASKWSVQRGVIETGAGGMGCRLLLEARRRQQVVDRDPLPDGPGFLHLVTQWMSTVSSVFGSAWNSSQLHFPTSDPPSCRPSVQLASGCRGVGQ